MSRFYIDGAQGQRHACAAQASYKTYVISFRNGILHVLNEIIYPSGPLHTANKGYQQQSALEVVLPVSVTGYCLGVVHKELDAVLWLQQVSHFQQAFHM